MKDKYFKFLLAVSINKIGKTGVILTTSAFVTFILLEIPRLMGILTNAYFGLITYLLLPTLFFIGLALIPFGWWKYKKTTGKSFEDLATMQFGDNELSETRFGANVFKTIAILTIVNVLFLSFASFRTLHFMDESEFCGTACHSVMNPEWVTYQQSPHARVSCVECHVGEGVDALVASKLNGAWQMLSVTFDLYEKPIPTPVHNLRPARETCEKCHWPDKFYGTKLLTIPGYKKDESNTPQYTTLNLKIDTGKKVGSSGIHWHISDENEVRYASADEKRSEMVWAESKQKDGSFKRFVNKNLLSNQSGIQEPRSMDCIDCHNRATHIYEDPERAIDTRIHSGLIDKSLPFIKREGYYAITKNYMDKETAGNLIANYIERFYRKNYPDIANSKEKEIANSVKTLQDIYHRNIHPEMKIEWGSYPNHIGHKKDGGCFRCHNPNMVDEAGTTIKYDCTLCHSILAYDSKEAFKYLQPVNKKDKDYHMHKELKAEFLHSVK